MRALRITLIVLLVLGGLFVAADRLAVNYVEGRLAEEAKSARGAQEAEVSVRGFPFLTQVASRELDAVDVTLGGVTARSGSRSLQVSEFEIQARRIALSESFTSAVAQTATGTAHVTYADLSAAAEEDVTISYGGPAEGGGASTVKVTGSARVPGLDRTVEASTTSTLTVEDGDTIRLHADEVPGEGIPGVEELIRQRIDFTRQIDGLPAGVRLTGIEATEDGVDVRFAGERISVTG
ncbi:DUF2993 domain-containing protein [Streptomyces sp. TRM 70351]|uniref:LmeA family phospholipid-binding protein n=1 Tax=Streptomyces sp. TRM 70351 TaxID=3116552 RepID=UPI002E7B170D|nr:DUF2993 domain-containing protein [Streptomyces sp. TRM 70351]MEE1930415.1 DUF2993 domain-containing protein [Streptomyces sp. TRM 70351]